MQIKLHGYFGRCFMDELDFTEKSISSTVIAKIGPYQYCIDKVRLPNGEEEEKSLVKHPGGVAILAVNDRKEIAIVRQYRYAVKQFLDEIPAGKLDKIQGEKPIDGAYRELREETGMIAKKMIPLGKVFPSPGIITEELSLFYAEDLEEGHQELDDDEFINIEWWSIERLESSIINGTMLDAKTLCAYQMARSKGLI